MSIKAKVTSRDTALDNFRSTTVDETSADLIKDGEGNLYGYNLLNPNGSAVFCKFFDVDGGATVGTDDPVFTVQLPANSSVVVGVADLPQLHFTNRLEIAATGAIGDTDSTTITSDVVAHVQYA